MRRNLGLKRGQSFAKACDMRLEASAHAGVTGLLQPVRFGEEHLLELVAPGFQVSKRQKLGRWRNIEAKIRGLKPIEGKNAGVDRIGLSEKAEIPGEMANARSVGLVRGDPEFFADFENMAFIAAGRLADDEERPKGVLGIAPHLGEERIADRLRLVRSDALFFGGQNMNNQTILGDFERDDMIECG
jgi:hypothetical protein